MTKELLFHRMELDLDTFLNSRRIHEEDDDETENLKSFPHRSIEEILNDSLSGSDSDSSSSPPSLVRSYSTPQHLLEDEDPDKSATEAPPKQPLNSAIAHPDHHYKAANSFALLRPPPDRQLPSLFGGVRSTAKPGAALAAAAAASRSIPTPHATAIKSRRALPRPPLPSPTKHLQSSSSSSSNDISRDPPGVLHGTDGNDDEKMPEQRNCSDANIDENEEIVDFQSAVGDGFDSVFLPQVAVEADSHKLEEVEVQEKEVISSVHEDLSTSNTGSSVSSHEDRMHFLGSVEENSTLTSIGQEAQADAASTVAISDGKDSVLEEQEVEAPILHESGEDGSVPEVDKLVEERIGQLENKRVNEKKSQVTLKPLELAELAERRQASTALDWEEGAAALPMRLEGVRRGSTTLGYFDVNPNNVVTRTISSQAFRRDHGSPQVLAVHTNCIAVGMSKGIILMVPCKYSPHHPDNMESKITLLGLQGERSYAAVTAISFNQQGDMLLAGYSDGHITVWDIQRASAAKIITGEHTAPVVHAFFLGQDSQVTRQFKAVSGDSNGLVLLHSFSVVPLLNRFTVKTQCLLDGLKTGTVLSASPLIYDELVGSTSSSSQGNSTAASSSSIGSMMGGVVGADAGWKLFNEGNSLIEEGVVIFVTYQTALVVRLSPALKVYATLSKPEGVREGSMPYAAWKSVNAPCGSSNEKSAEDVVERLSLLAIAWDRKVQVAKLVNSELKVYGKWSLDSAAIGVAWLDDQMLIVLTLTAQICLFARDGTMIHQTSFAVDGFRGDDLLTYHSQYINVFGNPEKAYHNSLAVRGASVYILGPAHLVVSRLLPWKERIQVLRKAGDWMGALNMAMTLFDGQAHGVIDLPRTLDAVQNAIMPYLVELLLSYVDEVFSYISLAYANQIGMAEHVDDQTSGSSPLQNEIKEQFARVGGVAVEFCVHIKRTDILFDEIFSKFASVQQRETFLELLEPYILKDMLSSLPPEVMQALVEHYSSRGWLQRVEQCVLHMDISSLDFNQVVKLCREHGLYCALVYLFNRGLDDFRSPLEELLAVYRNSQKETAAVLGYKMLVYLKYCFSGLAFPPGHGTLPARRLPSLRAELLRFLLEDSESSNSLPDGAYLNVYHLLEIDTEASLLVFQCAFTDEEANLDISSRDSANTITEIENDTAAESIKLTQELVNALIHVLDMDVRQIHESGSNETKPADMWPSSNDIGHIIEFLAYFVACKRAKVSKDVLTRILEHLIVEESSISGGLEQNVGSLKKRREKQVLSLLEIVPETDWEAAHVLHLCEKAQFHQVCGLIHTMQGHYLAALDSYMKDTGEPIHAFAFISSTLSMLSETECAAFRSSVITRIPGLVDLSREATLFLVVDHFSKESQQILSVLQSCPSSLFLYLKTVVEVHLYGTLDFSYLKGSDSTDVPIGKSESVLTKRLDAFFDRISDFPRFLRNNPIEVTDDMTERYLELLCQYDRNSVLKFLETFDSYRVEHCLRLCQEYGIRDAAAFLLERVGDVGSALLLSLSDLNEKFAKLEMAVSNFVSEMASSSSVGSKQFNTLLKVEEVQDIIQTLHACVGLCQRNTPRLNPEESEILWFKLLDSVCEPLMGLSNGKIAQKVKQGSSVGTEQGSDLRISKSDGIFRKLYSQFIKEIVEGMIGYVRLPVIMSKLLSDNGSQEFGDFKLTILGMLGTYGFERRILDTAKSLIEDDTFYTMSLLKKGASHGYAPRSLMCCICSCPLSKKNSPYLSDVRVFNCGHATHIQCEVVESGNSKRGEGSLSGCPVCLPKKSDIKGRSKSSSSSFIGGGEGEEGLVAASKLPSRHYYGRTSEGSTILNALENHNDVSDSGLQQLSRFELLGVLQKEQRGSMQIENLPPLRLAPPSVYHEKVKKGIEFLTMGETSSSSSSNGITRMSKSSKQQQLKEVKVKSSSLRFPLKSSIFGKERISRR